MKERLSNWIPAGIGTFTLVVSLLVYSPGSHKTHLTTAIMAACASLGWSAVISFLPSRRRILGLYMIMAVFVPVFALFLPRFFYWEPLWHWLLYGIMLISFLGLIIFVRTQKPYRPQK
ncbi:MAG: hypothetical protein JXA62_00020 [Candidatus Aminicenantes bacterium]|nr:hypothetical protein [Candidatus Aminicenantes bacterium]